MSDPAPHLQPGFEPLPWPSDDVAEAEARCIGLFEPPSGETHRIAWLVREFLVGLATSRRPVHDLGAHLSSIADDELRKQILNNWQDTVSRLAAVTAGYSYSRLWRSTRRSEDYEHQDIDMPSLTTVSRARNLADGEARSIREAAKLSLREVAAHVGVSAATLHRWELGQTTPRTLDATRWIAVLDSLTAHPGDGRAA